MLLSRFLIAAGSTLFFKLSKFFSIFLVIRLLALLPGALPSPTDKGMFEMSEKFKAGGSEIYRPADEVEVEKPSDAAE